ncbi:MAG: PHP domain-containing protein [Chloroflexota bacterium]
MTTRRCDLHLHTTASDGTNTPGELVALATAAGLAAIAVTDHDSTEGVAEAQAAAAQSGLEVIAGVELSTDVPQGEVHVLGYFVAPAAAELQETLRRLREGRRGRARKMVEKLTALGLPVEWERVKQLAGAGAVGRPHVAQALVEQGHVGSTTEAFDTLIGRSGPAYVERYKLTPADAVGLVLRAGGLPGLAHPVIVGAAEQLGEVELDSLLDEMVAAGLVALECYYADYPAEVTASLLEKARALHLIPTGGSDHHGRAAAGAQLGGVPVPYEAVESLKQRLANR